MFGFAVWRRCHYRLSTWRLASLLAFLSSHALANQTVWLTSIQPFTGADWDAGISMRIGAEIMLEEVNRKQNLLPGFDLKVVWQDGLCSKNEGTEIFLRNLFKQEYEAFAPGYSLEQLDRDGDSVIKTADTAPLEEIWNQTQVDPAPIGLLGSGCAGTAININKIAHMTNFPIVSNSATRPGLSDRSAFPNFWRTILPDTYFNGAWVAMAKILGFSSITAVAGETANWGSMMKELVQAARTQGVELKGLDLTAEVSGFSGYQMSVDSQSAAADVATGLKLLGIRVVILLMFHPRCRLVLCECHKVGYTNVIWMVLGWQPAGWWGIADTKGCTAADITQMATGFIAANMQFWRSNMTVPLACSSSMTAEGFRQEWLRRQNTTLDDLTMRPEGYVPALEAATTADAVCMYAQMLHELLVVQQLPLQSLSQRMPEAYTKIQVTFAATNFEGVAGTVKFGSNKADPDGSIIVQQMQKGGSIVDIASYSENRLVFLGLNNIKFGFPHETFFAGPLGATSIAEQAASFATCGTGLRLNNANNTCEPCPWNQVFVDVVGACTCKPGFVANGTGCTECPPGTFTGTSGRADCDKCPTGKFAATSGETMCRRCHEGTFGSSRGMSECTMCPVTKTTMSQGMEFETDCVCGVGMRPGRDNRCRDCGKSSETGLLCKGNNEVKISQGFHAADSTFSVFRCFGDPVDGPGSRCLEGYPGSNCAAGRTGVSCSLCLYNMKRHHDGTCIPCEASSSGDTALVVGGCFVFVMLIVLLYIAIDRRGSAQESHLVMLCGLAFTLSITMVQQLSVVGMFKRVKWPEPMANLLSWTQNIMFDVDIGDVGCVVTVSSLAHFAGKLGAMGISICIILLVHALWVPFVHKSSYRESCSTLITCIGTILLVFYITVISTVTGPLQCLKHPNGLSTSRAYDSTICWRGEHWTMVWLGICFLTVPLAFLTKCCHAVWHFPAKMQAGRVDFLQAYAFLFCRYRIVTYWYALVHVFRSLFLAIIPVLPNVSIQLICMWFVLHLSLIFNVFYRPWRVPASNIVDAFFTSSIMFVVLSAAFYTESDPSAALVWISVIIVLAAFIFFPLLLGATVFIYFTRKNKKPFQFFLCHHKMGAGSFARLLKMELETVKGVTRQVFLDCDHLMDLEVLFDQVASLTETLVIVASKEIFTRLWCVGEITTAKLKGLNTIKVILPDFEELEDAFIDNYQFYVPDLSTLSNNGISLQDAQEAMRWSRGLETVKVSPKLSNEALTKIAQQIVNDDDRNRCVTPSALDDNTSTAFIICDSTNLEATSAALILERLLRPLFAHTPRELPRVLQSGKQVPPSAQRVLLICTNGALEQESMMRALISAVQLQAVCFPIVVDDTFNFPSASFASEHRELVAKVHSNTEEVQAVMSDIIDMFKTIAVHLPSSSASQAELETQAKEIARRLTYTEGLRKTGKMTKLESERNSQSLSEVGITLVPMHMNKNGEKQLHSSQVQLDDGGVPPGDEEGELMSL